MNILFKTTSIVLLSVTLMACDGFDYDTDTSTSSPDETFTRSELAFNVLFSSLLLNDSGLSRTRDGFIAFFKSSSELEEIELRSNDDDDAVVGTYPWTIVNDELQVTYPNGAVCTSEKDSETGLQITASATCDGGEPDNDRIRNTMNRLVSLDEDDLSSNTVNIEGENNNSDNDQRIEFFSNGNFEVSNVDDNGDVISSTTELGVFADSEDFNNIVMLDNSDVDTDEYSLMMLLEGSLSSGTLLQLRYTKTTDALKEIRIYSIDSKNRWEIDSLYDNISVDE